MKKKAIRRLYGVIGILSFLALYCIVSALEGDNISIEQGVIGCAICTATMFASIKLGGFEE